MHLKVLLSTLFLVSLRFTFVNTLFGYVGSHKCLVSAIDAKKLSIQSVLSKVSQIKST